MISSDELSRFMPKPGEELYLPLNVGRGRARAVPGLVDELVLAGLNRRSILIWR